jgi:tetratricopeptide (TPR) repeat protein
VASNPRIDDLRKRLEKEPNSRLFAQLAEELRKDGEFEEAIRIARAGLARHPSYPSARMTLGRALFDTGDLASARQELQSVLEGAPDNILASRLLAECLEGLGDLEGALKRYRATLALSPGDKQITAHVRDLEGKLQSAARPSGASSGAPAAGAATEQAPIKVATVDEPMVLETSDERHVPAVAAAADKVAESAPEFELESAYDAPGTQWRAPTGSPAAPAEERAADSFVPPAAPPHDPGPAPPPAPFSPAAFEDPAVGERTLVDEPAPTIAVERPAAESSFEYAFDTPRAAPVAPEPPAPAPLPRPILESPPAAEMMPPLPEPVTAAASAAPAAASPASEDAELPPLPPVVAPAPPPVVTAFTAPEPLAAPSATAPAPPWRPAPSAPAPPVPAPPAAPPAAAPDEGELVSPTLAELYLNQGFPEKAIEVYRRLLEREPANERAQARVSELQALVSAPAGAAAPARPSAARGSGEAAGAADSDQARAARRQALERTIERLESLRAALQKGAR